MKYIITTTEIPTQVNSPYILLTIPILSGKYINKFAYDLSSLKTFPDVFKIIPYEIDNLIDRDFVNTYPEQPEIDQYRLIDVMDLYNETININLFDNFTLQTFIINRPYINGNWTDADVVFYVNQLNEENRKK
jgi:hypothetical protein